MTIDPSVQPGSFAGRQPISDEDVLKLRRNLWADGTISPDEASQLFTLNDQAAPTNEWTDFFVEAMCDYLIGRGQPHGYVTEADASWLMQHISRDGRVDSHAELELLAKLFERAESTPESLKQFALSQIEQTVLSGRGPTRRGDTRQPGRIDDSEVALLRRMIFAAAGDGPAKVSRSEAEMLFRLKDATLGADNSAEWQRLFVQGIANHVMAHQAYVPPSAEVAARLEQVRKTDPLRMVSQMLDKPATFAEIKSAMIGDEASRIATHDSAVKRDAEVTSAEADWLKRLFDADGARDPMEQALLDFLAEDGAQPF